MRTQLELKASAYVTARKSVISWVLNIQQAPLSCHVYEYSAPSFDSHNYSAQLLRDYSGVRLESAKADVFLGFSDK